MAENYFYSKHSAQEMEDVFDGAVLSNKGQTLSTSQKAQARANIGAGSENTGFQILGYYLTLQEMKDSLQVPPQPGDAYGTAVFRLTTDAAPEAGVKYYTRSGSGTTEDPYTYTLFEGASFDPGVDYYVISYYDTYVYDGASMDWLDIGPINEGEFIDDSEISPILTWSSQKIKNELDAIDLSALIDDSDTAADTTWSSNKISSELSGKATPADVAALVDDSTTSASTTWSSQKIAAEIEKCKWKLLWTNSDLSANFAAQTISLDLSGYTEFACDYTTDVTGGTPVMRAFAKMGERFVMQYFTTDSSKMYPKLRTGTISATGVQFTNNQQYTATDNTHNKPYRIYAR